VTDLNPTGRFSSRVDDYVRYRPSYPQEILPLLERECGLAASSAVADIGSGTGFLAKLFLDRGCSVRGVEPNAEMRRAGDAFLSGYPSFQSFDGIAERTGLPDASVDLVAAGQAFHWFDAAAARAEFRRVLRQPRWVVLIWNERRVSGPFLEGYETLLNRWAPEYKVVDHRRIDANLLREFFGRDDWKLATFDNEQVFDFAGVRGRLMSSSYAPQPGSDAFEPMMDELERLFHEHQDNGSVRFLYDTVVYYGRL
jgi:SAM-dependent methyltransferase